MNMTILMALLTCTMGGFLIGAVVGIVLGHDIAVARQDRKKTPDLTTKAVRAEDQWSWTDEPWLEDILDPEGEWK